MIGKSPKMSHFGHLKDDCLEKYSAQKKVNPLHFPLATRRVKMTGADLIIKSAPAKVTLRRLLTATLPVKKLQHDTYTLQDMRDGFGDVYFGVKDLN